MVINQVQNQSDTISEEDLSLEEQYENDQTVMSQVADKVDNSAITQYKHKLDAKFPIRERDLEHPSYSSLLGCLCIKILLIIFITVLLIMHSLGMDGSVPIPNPLAPKMILTDLCIGFSAFGVVSVFTYFYVRIKNPAFAVLVFVAACAVVFIAFVVWNATAPTGGMLVLPIILIIVCLIPLVMDVWGLITYDRHN